MISPPNSNGLRTLRAKITELCAVVTSLSNLTVTIEGKPRMQGKLAIAGGASSIIIASMAEVGDLYIASDRRLKKNIKKIGTSPNGIPIYQFEFKNEFLRFHYPGRCQGTLVEDVVKLRPDAITKITIEGKTYRAVNYSALDVEFLELK